jgi:hypothetical protein
MEAREFYDKRMKEDPEIGSVQLMEEYAKHIVEINFCGPPRDITKLSSEGLMRVQRTLDKCVEWVNS